MRARLVIPAAVAIAVASVSLAITRGSSSTSVQSQAASSSLPSRPASYLGVYESGPPHTYQPVTDSRRRQAVPEPRRVLQRLGSSPLRDRSRRQSAATAPSRSCRWIPPTPPSRRSRPETTTLPARVRRQCPGLRPPSRHRLRARDERQLVLVGLQACPGADVRGCMAAHRVAVPQPGRRQRHLAVDDQPGSIHYRPPGLVVAWGSICHLGRHRRLLLPPLQYFHAPCSARLSLRSGRSPASRCCSPRQAWDPRPASPRRSSDLFAGMRQYQTLGLVWFDIAQHQGIYHQDWRIEDSRAATAAFRRSASSLTLARP